MANTSRAISVLLVDDNDDFLISMTRALERRGLKVYKSSSGEFVREMLEKIPVDVAVLDLKMPGVDGHELFAEFRRRMPHVPIIILTGHGDATDAFSKAKHGVFEYLGKPCEVETLERTIRDAVDPGGQAREPEPGDDGDSTVRVLLVDDEPDFLRSTEAVLRRRGFVVRTAGSGDAALDILAAHPVDVAVVDVKMPGMDGLGLLQKITDRRISVEVILLTGHAAPPAAVKGIKAGAYDFVLKPIDTDELAAKIRSAARRKQGDEERRKSDLIQELIRKSPS